MGSIWEIWADLHQLHLKWHPRATLDKRDGKRTRVAPSLINFMCWPMELILNSSSHACDLMVQSILMWWPPQPCFMPATNHSFPFSLCLSLFCQHSFMPGYNSQLDCPRQIAFKDNEGKHPAHPQGSSLPSFSEDCPRCRQAITSTSSPPKH